MGRTSDKLAALRAARVLKRGKLIAHQTATLPGIAAYPRSQSATRKLCQFKQRQGPFLMLVDSVSRACKQIRYFSPVLRKKIRGSWPGPVTLIVPARPSLSKQCYQKGSMAIRVDQSLQTRQLIKASGGMLLSSSLNRRGKQVLHADKKLQMRMHRHLALCLAGEAGSGKASTLLRVWRNDSTTIRP